MQSGYHSATAASGVLHDWKRVQGRLTASLMVSCICLGFFGPAFSGERFPGYEPDRKALDTQQKVDQLFDRGAFERAIVIYRDELAPLGDKYAQ